MCPFCKEPRAQVIKKGFFPKKKSEKRKVQRYYCRDCKKNFSEQTGKLTYRERKPHINQTLFRHLCKGVSQRGCAFLLDIHPITVARKLVRLSRFAKLQQERYLQGRAFHMVLFDEMETYEHTKCKPISLAIAVEYRTRRILAINAASMPPKGLLAAFARKKYGYRKDCRPVALRDLLVTIKNHSVDDVCLRSDMCPRYPIPVKRMLPKASHEQFKGRRGCIVGQGELKAGGHDPLFFLNHTCAMVRDNLKRLTRRTWCSTKRLDRLQDILNLYICFHNMRIDKVPRRDILITG